MSGRIPPDGGSLVFDDDFIIRFRPWTRPAGLDALRTCGLGKIALEFQLARSQEYVVGRCACLIGRAYSNFSLLAYRTCVAHFASVYHFFLVHE
jgi:hypothetical protein